MPLARLSFEVRLREGGCPVSMPISHDVFCTHVCPRWERRDYNGLIFEIAAGPAATLVTLPDSAPPSIHDPCHDANQPRKRGASRRRSVGTRKFYMARRTGGRPRWLSLSLARSRSPPFGWAFGEPPSSESRHHGRGARESFIAVWPAYCCAQPAVPLAILGSIVSLASTNPSGTVFLKYLMQIELTQCRSSVGVCFSP